MLDYDWHLSTPRLYISHVNPSNDIHCDFFVEYMSDRGSAKLDELSRTMPKREAIAKLHILPRLERMEKLGWGRYLVSLKPEAVDEDSSIIPFSQRHLEPIGCVTMQLARYPGGGPTAPDLGFSFLDRYQGKGYATEAAQRLMKYFEEERGQKGFLGLTDPDNDKAKKMFQRMGFEDRGERDVVGVVEGKTFMASVWSKGLEGDLEEYGFQ
ncbi:hypothetical protein K4K49_009922 [Colletotrichum sp. SAR 10_70]|nr:hypothetical protein K4K50_004199 [Colletotrichum sp. SAR 10_71]KAI8191676.1 hypothetical protein K4K51_011029 [Colletotrichum sp. SAR 10_75]KAI8194198.1 hypothetical protein K4K49_009922 [Colletotrichum sp. SAR 10_70]KAI8199340.1 hypothetical protein KHU50_007807 [Colletotrichum sp. SAR 10_65]KAI8214368.1 hypothetical protein K4K52_001351 [Colletotrichum sp. SAR 10_76]KAI8232703.1 hypothetical protein K4K54_011525 [Colletotrichum sp. SAR 10_86]KAJ5007551.1 hypothetical protein K4K48_01243